MRRAANAGEPRKRHFDHRRAGVPGDRRRTDAVGQKIGAGSAGDADHVGIDAGKGIGADGQRAVAIRVIDTHRPAATAAGDHRMVDTDLGESLERRLDRRRVGIPAQRDTALPVAQHVGPGSSADRQRTGIPDDRAGDVHRLAVVADQDVVAAAAGQRIVAATADQDRLAFAAGERVAVTERAVDAANAAQRIGALDAAGISLLAEVADEYETAARIGHGMGVDRVPAFVAVDHEELGQGRSGEADDVVTLIAVERRHVVDAGTGDIDVVGTASGPDVDAVTEVAAAARVITDGRCQREAAEVVVAEHGRHAGCRFGKGADVERVVAGPGVDGQRALDVLQGTVDRPGRAAEVERDQIVDRIGAGGDRAGEDPHRVVGHVEDIVATPAGDRGRRRSAKDGKVVVAGTKPDVERLDIVVIDAALACRQFCAACAQAAGIDCLHRRAAVGAAEGQDEAAVMQADRHVARVRTGGVGILRVEDRLQGAQEIVGTGAYRNRVGPGIENLQPEVADSTGTEAQRLHRTGKNRTGRAIAAGVDRDVDAGFRRRQQGIGRAGRFVPEQFGNVLAGQFADKGDEVGIAALLNPRSANDAKKRVDRRRQIGFIDIPVERRRPPADRTRHAVCRDLADRPQHELARRRTERQQLLFGQRRHAEAAQRGAGQHGGAVVRVARIVDIDGVGGTAAEHRQQCGDLVRHLAGATDVEGVGATPRVDQGVAGKGLNVEGVGTVAAADLGGSGVRREDGEGIGAGTQFELERLEIEVADAAGEGLAGDDRVAAHAESVEAVGGEEADVVRWALAVQHREHVDLGFLVGREVGVQRRKVVAIAGGGRSTRRPAVAQNDRVVFHCSVEAIGIGGGSRRTGDVLIDQSGEAFGDVLIGVAAGSEVGVGLRQTARPGQGQAVVAARTGHLAERDLDQFPVGAGTGAAAGDAASALAVARPNRAEARRIDERDARAACSRRISAGEYGGEAAGDGHQGQTISGVRGVGVVGGTELELPHLPVADEAFEPDRCGSVGLGILAGAGQRACGIGREGLRFVLDLDDDGRPLQPVRELLGDVGARIGVEQGEDIGEIVDPRIEAGHHPADRVDITRVDIGDGGDRTAGVGTGGGQQAVSRQEVVLAGQHQRVGQEGFGCDPNAAIDGDRPADQVDPLAI